MLSTIDRHVVYALILHRLGLSPEHRDLLRLAGYTDTAIERAGYRSWPVDGGRDIVGTILRHWPHWGEAEWQALGVLGRSAKRSRKGQAPLVLLPESGGLARPDIGPDGLIRTIIVDQRPRLPVVVRLSQVDREEVGWIWWPWIPAGKLTIVEGDPGLGKTWLALEIAAAVSRGRPLPGQDPQDPGHVVYLTAEDGLGDTLRPRLEAAGADLERIYALTGIIDPHNPQPRDPITLGDRGPLRDVLVAVRPRLVVIDPLQGFFGANVDLHRANETRPVLAGLGALAAEFGCAFLLIRHLGKASQDRPIYRGLGSIDISAAARSVLLVAADPDNPARRVLAHVKSSLAPQAQSLAFSVGNGQFRWEGVSSLTPDQLLAPALQPEERSALDEAKDFLSEMLASGPKPSDIVKREAKQAGIAEITLRRAADALGVAKHRQSQTGGPRGAGSWFWSLPSASSPDTSWEPDYCDEQLDQVEPDP